MEYNKQYFTLFKKSKIISTSYLYTKFYAFGNYLKFWFQKGLKKIVNKKLFLER